MSLFELEKHDKMDKMVKVMVPVSTSRGRHTGISWRRHYLTVYSTFKGTRRAPNALSAEAIRGNGSIFSRTHHSYSMALKHSKGCV
jgi:hypothetical protein